MPRPSITFATIILCGGFSLPASAQIMGFNGSWTLNKELSEPKAQCEYLHYVVTPEEEHYIVDEISVDGSKFQTEYKARFDGKEYPNPNKVTGTVNYVKLKKVFDRVEQLTNVRREKGPNGQEISVVTGHYVRILAPDGKSITSVLLNADGQVRGVRHFDKVTSAQRPKC